MKSLTSFPRAAVIDSGALESNIRLFADHASPAALMAVLKADAYGHGMATAARAALQAGVEDFGVALVSEALQLRRIAGPGPRILAWLHGQGTDFDAALASDIELATSGAELEEILSAAQRQSRAARLHLKIDTGLGRNGALEEGWVDLFRRAAAAQAAGTAQIVGLMTHLAVADEPERSETDEQREAFERAAALAQKHGLTGLTLHCANTAAALTRRDMHFDMVRVGLGLYGLLPFPAQASVQVPEAFSALRPAMALQAPVTLVKKAPAGQGVSYGLGYVLQQPSWLGLIPLGYADGIPRIAQGASVRIGQKQYPVVGRIAMDQMVVDLGPDDAAADLLGATAVVFGAEQHDPTAESWAEASGTINYEIVTRISPRAQRRVIHRVQTQTVEQTHAAAARFASGVRAGDVVVLSGPLGAGKTTFTQGLAQALGVRGQVSSPTFVLAREHRGDHGRPGLVHVDAYRLTQAVGISGVQHSDEADPAHTDLSSLGLDEALEHSVIVVEWGEGLDPDWGRRTFLITLEREPTAQVGRGEDGALDFDDEESADPRVITWEQISPDSSSPDPSSPQQLSNEESACGAHHRGARA